MVKLKINLEKGAENEDKTAKSDDPVDGNSRQYCPRAEHCECIGEEEAHKGSNADAVNVLKRKIKAGVKQTKCFAKFTNLPPLWPA